MRARSEDRTFSSAILLPALAPILIVDPKAPLRNTRQRVMSENRPGTMAKTPSSPSEVA